MNSYVLYYRVSTERQGERGYGLGAQQDSIMRYLGDRANIIAEFTEVRTGKDNERKELKKAIALCKQTGAILTVSKLDRLGREAAYLHKIRGDVPILDVDNPSDDPLMFAVKAGMAETERKRISIRTSEALQRKIAKEGKYINNPLGIGLDKAIAASAIAKKEAAENNENNRRAISTIALLMKLCGRRFNWTICSKWLNSYGFYTSKGVKFSPQAALQLWERRHNFEFYNNISDDISKFNDK